MSELDLHGQTYDEVELIVRNFIHLNNPPYRIITGKSMAMHKIVKKLLDEYNLEMFFDNPNNFGSFIVTEKL